MRILEDDGYRCSRGSGSHGIDITAWLPKENRNVKEQPILRFIEVKYGSFNLKETIKKIKKQEYPNIVSVEIWHYIKGKKYPSIITLKKNA